MLAPVELVLGDIGELPAATTGFVFPAGATVSSEPVKALAAALGVEGDPVAGSPETGMAWQVGPSDGTAASLTVSASAPLSWWYSADWEQPVEAPACMPVTTIPGTGTSPEQVVPCLAPAPPAGVPTAAEAEERARQLLVALGADLDAVQFDVHADEWFANVQATQLLDGVRSPISWSFGFGPEGALQHANGMLASPEPVGPYPLLDLNAAFTRLQEQQAGGGWFARDMLAIEAVPAPLATTVTVSPRITAALPAPAPDTPVSAVVEPVEPAMTYPPETMPPVVVTLVAVEADLWWVTDVDGSGWLLPAYRFIGDDGGWYTVPAVTDEYLIVVEPEPVEPPEPLPAPATTTVPSDPPAPAPVPGTELPELIDVAALKPFVGLTLEEFTVAVEEVGGTVRVVEEDGVELVVTDDYRTDRVNVAVDGGVVTRIVGAG